MKLSETRTYAGLGACFHWLPCEINGSGNDASYSVIARSLEAENLGQVTIAMKSKDLPKGQIADDHSQQQLCPQSSNALPIQRQDQEAGRKSREYLNHQRSYGSY
jgi:hypothetical protein